MLFRRGKKQLGTTPQPSEAEGSATTRASILYKRIGYGSALALTFLFVPLVAQGLPGMTEDTPDQPQTGGATNGQVESATTPDATEQSDTSIDVSQNGQGQSSNNSSVNVTVNGQSVPVPSNGSVKKKITDSNGNATVDVSIENHQSGTTSVNTHSSTSVDFNNNSWSNTNDDDRGGDRYSNHR